MSKNETMNIFFDTNILIHDCYWKGHFPQLLIDANKQIPFRVYISYIVRLELKTLVLELNGRGFSNLKKEKKRLGRFEIDKIVRHDEEQKEQEFEDFYQNQLPTMLQLYWSGFATRNGGEASLKLINKEKPFHRAKKELKDYLILLTYLDSMRNNHLSDCYLITENVEDFCGVPSGGNANQFQVDADLLAENESITVFTSLESFYNTIVTPHLQYAAKYEPFYKEVNFDENYLLNELLSSPRYSEIENAVRRQAEADLVRKWNLQKIDTDDYKIAHDVKCEEVRRMKKIPFEDTIKISCLIYFSDEISVSNSTLKKEAKDRLGYIVFTRFLIDPEKKVSEHFIGRVEILEIDRRW